MMSKEQRCYTCGNEQFEERRIRYIYSRGGKYLLVPDMPADICLSCGMVYYHGDALLRVEQRFKAIHQRNERPYRYTTMPVMDYS
jgi:YgiT-type zinc finger domain-containing protein